MSDDPKLTINPGYAVGQLLHALQTATTHERADVRARADEKVRRWQRALTGMADGTTVIGGRTPVQGVPAWATLEVVTGGFATGALLAEGPLLPHEEALLARVQRPEGVTARGAIHAHYLSDAGLDEMRAMLRTGRYRVNVPEEGALLVFVWLVDHGRVEKALDLLDAITGFFDRLRFYPVPDEVALTSSSVARLQTVSKVIAGLEASRAQAHVARMNEALRHWNPMCDAAVSLLLETVEGDAPTLRVDASGELARGANGQPVVDGGWPCKVFPAGWRARAQALLDAYAAARAKHRLCKKPDDPKENFAQLRDALARCARDPSTLTGRDVGRVRKVLASCVWRRGAPGSASHRAVREAQAAMAALPSHAEYRRLLVARLRGYPAEGGIASMEPIALPLTDDEARSIGAKAGAVIPSAMASKAERCLEAPVSELVARGVIPSGDVLAVVLPQLTSQVRASAFDDPDLRRAYGAIDAAFRRRRSLLLLNLQHQVKVSELPWVSSLDGARARASDASAQNLAALREVTTLAVTSFPEAIIPNKLLQEIVSLAEGAGLKLPLVDEIAADIFMGMFSEKFLRAAQVAGRMLRDTLYARYYDLPVDRVLGFRDLKTQWGVPTSPGYAALCVERAGVPTGRSSSVAQNGAVIEQSQILTTQNLAVLFDALDLRRELAPRLGELALRCFTWVCRQVQTKVDNRHTRLVIVKNSAYAWRQMLFFASLLDDAGREAFLDGCAAHFAEQDEVFRMIFAPGYDGLVWVARGGSFDSKGVGGRDGTARRFLGWSTGVHWLVK